METAKNVICEGDHVIIKKGTAMRLFQVKKERQIYFDKRKLNLDGVLGSPFGSTFEVKNKILERVNRKSNRCSEGNDETSGCDVEPRDNRFLNDDGKSQKLSKDDIEALKDDGLTGKDIIKQLIENSSTFKDKSEYSKEKYLKKKEKKYLSHVTVLRVTTRLLTQMYYSQNPMKTLNMRMDSLAQILTQCNVHSGGKYLVVENCMGLVVGAVLERLDGRGKLVQVHSGDISARQTINAYNFNETQRECLISLNWQDLKTSSDHNIERSTDEPEDSNEEKETKSRRFEESSEKLQRRMQREKERDDALQTLESRNMDGLIVASKFHPSKIVLRLLPFLELSRPFTIFCPYKEPLIDCYTKLKESGTCLMLRLSETWCRTLQVLPNRTHPENNMSGTGGYILTGITAQPNSNDSNICC